jgi:hypothetical protein
MGLNTSMQQYVEGLNHLNHYLLYFSVENPKQVDQDEIIEILEQAKAPQWMKQWLMPRLMFLKCLNEMYWNHDFSYYGVYNVKYSQPLITGQ